MTITASGAICDVCGEYILPIDPNERVNEFTMPGIKETLYCDNKCKQLLQSIKDWHELPSGPVRKVFEDTYGLSEG